MTKSYEYLLSQSIDTINIKSIKLKLIDSNINICIDSFINRTKNLSDYNTRLLPLFFIGIRQNIRGIIVDIEANNNYSSLDIEALFNQENFDSIGLKIPTREVFLYKENKFIIDLNLNNAFDSSIVNLNKKYFVIDSGSINIQTYRFYSKKTNNKIEFFLHWANKMSFLLLEGHFILIESQYYRR